MTDSDATTSP